MALRVGLEVVAVDHTLAWVLEHPGCYAYAPDESSALAAVPRAVADYARWSAAHGGAVDVPARPDEPVVDGVWSVYCIDESFDVVPEGYETNAWFQHDWKPLADHEVERALRLADWTRGDLLAAVAGLDDAFLDRREDGERWSIRGILSHVATAEWWYLDRLGLAPPRSQLPADAFERLIAARAVFGAALDRLAGSRSVVGADGEFWSPRKVVRRALWHERDHTQHIARLATACGAG